MGFTTKVSPDQVFSLWGSVSALCNVFSLLHCSFSLLLQILWRSQAPLIPNADKKGVRDIGMLVLPFSSEISSEAP